MYLLPSGIDIYLAPGVTDMRKSVNGLSLMVNELELDVLKGNLFAFCNRTRTIIKILYWDRNGFCLWYKKLEKDRFRWPKSREEVLKIDSRQLTFLLEGLSLDTRGLKQLHFSQIN